MRALVSVVLAFLILTIAALLLAPYALAAPSFDATVTWTDNSNNEDGFNVYRDGAKVGSTGAGISTYTDTGLAQSTRYCYKIGAFNTAGETMGPEACGTTGVVPVPPAAPGTPTIIFIGKP